VVRRLYDGRGRDYVVGDYIVENRPCLVFGLVTDCDCDFVGGTVDPHDLLTSLVVVTDFGNGNRGIVNVNVNVRGSEIVLLNGIGLVVVIEVQDFVGGISCLKRILFGLVWGREMFVDFVGYHLEVFVSLLTVVNLVPAN